MTIISLGAGVQSSTIALMAAYGEITPMPDCAIFADTGAEPDAVYAWLDFLETVLLTSFPVYRVMENKGLEWDLLDAIFHGRVGNPPFYTKGKNGIGMLRRSCTTEFKRDPIRRKVRELLGLKKGARAGRRVLVNLWLGISTDEAARMKDNDDVWIKNRWPLIEKRMSRWDCLRWLDKAGYAPPPKSACIFCPYHNDAYWREMKLNDPKSWNKAVEIDRKIRNGIGGTTHKLYVHGSGKPLDQVDFSTDEDHGQLNMFNNECEGRCGV